LADTKEAVLSFIREHHVQHEKPPSLDLMCKKVEGLSRRKFYELFKGGVAEACRIAGVPEPEDRIKATAKAREEKDKPPETPALLEEEAQAEEAEAALEVKRKRWGALERVRKIDVERLELEAMEDPKKVIPYLKTLEPEIVAPFFDLCQSTKLDPGKAWGEAIGVLGQTWEEWGRAVKADGEEPYLKAYITDVIEAFIPQKRLKLTLGHHCGKTYSCTCGKCGLSYEYEDKGDYTFFTCPNGCIQDHGGVNSIYPCPVCGELGRAVNLSYDRSRNVLHCKTCSFEGEVKGSPLNPVGTKVGAFRHQIAELEEKVKGLQGKLSETQRQINAGVKEEQALERLIGEKQQTCESLRNNIVALSAESEKNRQECEAELRRAEAMNKKNDDVEEKIEILNSVALFIMDPEKADIVQLRDFVTQVGTAIELRKRPGHVGEAVKMAVEARDHLLKMAAGSRYILRVEADKKLKEQLARQRGEYEVQLKAKDDQIASERRLKETAQRKQETQLQILL